MRVPRPAGVQKLGPWGFQGSIIHKDTEVWVSENFVITNHYKATINKTKYIVYMYKSLQNYH